ncbi:MAG TPA: ATP-binding protein [Methanocorpusculum sp.]|nr:ATP-binding protein [Methanocorpusculum sp.]
MKLIERMQYLDIMVALLDVPDIKVITGIRRCGKSALLLQFTERVQSVRQDVNIIRLNLDRHEAEPYLEYHRLYDFVESQYQEGRKNVVCIDEVQMCSGFEKAISWLHESGKYSLYITGSNAFLSASDLATLFTGRTFEIPVFPFSFAEYCAYYPEYAPFDAFGNYLQEGGMPGAYLLPSQQLRYQYVSSVFSTLIVRDIQAKYHIRNVALLQKVTDFLLDNVGNQTSLTSIAKQISVGNTMETHQTIGKYITYLERSFLFYKIPRYDVAGKKYLSTQEKYYLCDHVFRYAVHGRKNQDYGRVMENIVAIELLRRGYEVYVGVLRSAEIDFIALRRDEKLYIQVCDDISHPETFKREITPLLQIKDNYPKIILTRTWHEPYDHEGVQICDLGGWLRQTGSRGP